MWRSEQMMNYLIQAVTYRASVDFVQIYGVDSDHKIITTVTKIPRSDAVEALRKMDPTGPVEYFVYKYGDKFWQLNHDKHGPRLLPFFQRG